MKKIKIKKRKKGFTLIELLAIIVILAIIMVVTIPTVLGSLADARRKTFQNSVNSVAEWIEKQYGLAIIEDSKVSKEFNLICNNTNNYCEGDQTRKVFLLSENTDAMNFLKAAGVDADNYEVGHIWINKSSRRACVKLFVNKNGDFKSVTPKMGEIEQGKNGLYFIEESASPEAVSGSYDNTDLVYMKSPGCE